MAYFYHLIVQVKFFEEYSVKSQKEKCHMVMKLDISTFIEDLKVLLGTGGKVLFKLSQDQTGMKYFDVMGKKDDLFTSTQIKIDSFDKDVPVSLPSQEVEFQLDPNVCQFVLWKFHTRINIIEDKSVNMLFTSVRNEGEKPTEQEEENTNNYYSLQLKSEHMTSNVQNKQFQANFTDYSRMREEYSVTLKREVLKKFFQCLKMPGMAIFRISNEQEMEFDYTLEKCQHITMVMYGLSRQDRF